MRRRIVRPFGVSVRPTRIVSLVIAIAVLFMLYGRFRDPNTWRVLFELPDDVAAAELPPETGFNEEVVPGPNDLDKDEQAKVADLFEMAVDKVPLKPREMHAYWRLMTWARTESFEKLNSRAQKDVLFTQFWEQPEKYRGKLVTLRMHVKRVIKYDAPENPQGLKVCYEAWGWTDDSKSFPYVVVFPDCPPSLPIGSDVKGEIVFVGYFLKIMGYTAFDTARGAPLLIGRVQSASRPAPQAAPTDPWTFLWIVLGGILIIALFMWLQFRSNRIKRLRRPIDLPVSDNIEIGPSRSGPTDLDLTPSLALSDDD